MQQALGDGLGLLDLVELVVTAEDVVDGKPHPAGYLLACERLGHPPGHDPRRRGQHRRCARRGRGRVGHVVGVTTSRDAGELLDAARTRRTTCGR